MRIKLIIFDLWQTLAYRDVDYSTTSKMLEETRVEIAKDKFVKIFEKSIQTKKWNSKFEAYKNLCQNMDLETNEKNINLLIKIRDKAEAETKLYSHTISMLKQLRQQKYKIGLISNSSIFAVEQIKKRTNLLEYIDYPLFSFDVGIIKPNLQFFKEMLKISSYKPKETIMIGDKLNDDVIPPRKIGMNSIHFKNYEQLKQELKNFNITI
ncbi:MAG: HAD family hydrolase [Nanoarchaeota archaeon]|nr:HAD family hydrolase [Nanoarchaeota archaeon]